jgi:hypothetical protein
MGLIHRAMIAASSVRETSWRGPYLDLRTGLFVPRLVTWDPATGEFTSVDGPKGFATWEEAEEAGRFLCPGASPGWGCPGAHSGVQLDSPAAVPNRGAQCS